MLQHGALRAGSGVCARPGQCTAQRALPQPAARRQWRAAASADDDAPASSAAFNSLAVTIKCVGCATMYRPKGCRCGRACMRPRRSRPGEIPSRGRRTTRPRRPGLRSPRQAFRSCRRSPLAAKRCTQPRLARTRKHAWRRRTVWSHQFTPACSSTHTPPPPGASSGSSRRSSRSWAWRRWTRGCSRRRRCGRAAAAAGPPRKSRSLCRDARPLAPDKRGSL